MPIFINERAKSADDLKSSLLDLEFGRELSYFKGKGAMPEKGPVLREKSTTVYAVDIGDSELLLFTTGTPERPWAVVRQYGGKREIYWYGIFEQLPFDSKLFAKPSGVKIEEAK